MSQSRMDYDVQTGSKVKRTDDAGECTEGRALSRPLRPLRFQPRLARLIVTWKRRFWQLTKGETEVMG